MSVFGNVSLGYLVVETARFADWRRFGRDAIGMHLDDLSADAMRFRLDAQECRFLLQRGPAEDVTTLGWQVDDHETFDEILQRVRRCGVPVTAGTDEEAALRGVERLVRIPGPNGLAQELYTSARAGGEFTVAGAGFVTGEYGLGHVAVTSTKPHQVRGYYNTLLDARLSDFIDETMSGIKVKIRFLRVNRRHHSVAIAATNRLPINPIRTRVQHLNIQVDQFDDLTASYQRVRALGFDVALDMGQHSNDRELSFYAVTPSGFEWEVGWNPLIVDESTWRPTTHQGISIWGHEMQRGADRLGQFTTAARSLLRREDTVPALAGAGIPD
ncbi:extradiol ring-cleavage dioxygenase [Mycobacterium sp. CBMA293]|uniref:VOC family protein n=2 Tax=Mycolicibacterium TaxID=1866885 RepID=UPI0012DD5CC7|nr:MULTISPECIES: VOC family protein [unclassified Mycolicibacterium]MUL48618.1 extradiol ring-cleavage dioxygenase [Mycolicibacterium sp. CBMA 360]MUL60884.1 extradiol ring-cleavage dioxygenase [Mycolicibacterium sp. CBMA 335]MUL71897.1 extradiol ring-cleavage dioxygenase [Mycolicibacterium sp. CBMA 311]MUL95825.1 extradiol ring-cleavage dioxygenase [Mycolicibacterium sp. CBMA 230]MUM06424.1 extradiol ring-cleavage dioxygenase [Mycolicibacterium sp. CBMA 213]